MKMRLDKITRRNVQENNDADQIKARAKSSRASSMSRSTSSRSISASRKAVTTAYPKARGLIPK